MTGDLLNYGNLSVPEPGSSSAATADLSFSLATFCLMGLPLYKPANPIQNFVRRSPGKYALTIRPFEITLDDGTELRVPIPFGVMPRYTIFWIMTQVARSRQREIPLGVIKDWSQEIGLKGRADQLLCLKDQLVRLTFVDFNLQLVEGEGEEDRITRRTLIDEAVFSKGDLLHYANGRLDKMRWPKSLVVSEWFYRAICDYVDRNNVVPIATVGLRQLTRTPMAIDFFAFLSLYLPTLKQGDERVVPWSTIIGHFGQNQTPTRFLKDYRSSIERAIAAYPGANVEIAPDQGLILRYTDRFPMEQLILEPVCAARALKRLRYRVKPRRGAPMQPVQEKLL
jgi:hypothetical protein